MKLPPDQEGGASFIATICLQVLQTLMQIFIVLFPVRIALKRVKTVFLSSSLLMPAPEKEKY